jgi:predicted dithiol-disulfide oxidoreductase (DUF899 family)
MRRSSRRVINVPKASSCPRAYAERMGWKFPWVSSLGSDFKYDFGEADARGLGGAEFVKTDRRRARSTALRART